MEMVCTSSSQLHEKNARTHQPRAQVQLVEGEGFPEFGCDFIFLWVSASCEQFETWAPSALSSVELAPHGPHIEPNSVGVT